MQTTTCCKPINYLNTNGTKKHKMNNKIQHVWKQWSKKNYNIKNYRNVKLGWDSLLGWEVKVVIIICNLQN